MSKIDNSEAYDTISWILDNADIGFFIVTATPHMQQKIAKLYKTLRVAIYDFLHNSKSNSFSKLSEWAESQQDTDVLFILNMQLAFTNKKGLISEENLLLFNMSRDILAKKRKIWLFFMTKEAEHRLSTFAYDIYSHVRQKAHFQDEEERNFEGRQILEFEECHNIIQIKDMLARYKELEERYLDLSLENTPDNQLLSSAISLNNIATLYKDCADYKNALRLFERIIAIREKALGKEHPDAAATYNNIAEVYDNQGEYDKALEWHEKALAIREKALGKEHPDTATTYNNIALVCDNQGEYNKALEWHEKALAISEKALGKEHPSTATTYNNIAGVYNDQGEYEKALEWYEKALAIREKALGKEHPDTTATYNNIARVYKMSEA
jgi:tetratricopeptide (TPR) repeat protein